MLSTLDHRAGVVTNWAKKNKAQDSSLARFVAGIANLIDQTLLDEVTCDEWDDHELAWQAYVARLRSELVFHVSKVMIAIEKMAKREPEKITPEIAKQLYWWKTDGGRESLLSELPIEQRRALEREGDSHDI